jgi:hypothetical protein
VKPLFFLQNMYFIKYTEMMMMMDYGDGGGGCGGHH